MFAEFIELLFANYDVCGILSGKMASQILVLVNMKLMLLFLFCQVPSQSHLSAQSHLSEYLVSRW